MLLSTAMLLRHSCGLEEEASAIEQAVTEVIEEGHRTADLGGGASSLGTRAMADLVIGKIGG
jgi:3-isopropylmalate dehydrogenase